MWGPQFKSPKTRRRRRRRGVRAMMKFQSPGSKLWNFARQGDDDRLIVSSGRSRVTERGKEREGEKKVGKKRKPRGHATPAIRGER